MITILSDGRLHWFRCENCPEQGRHLKERDAAYDYGWAHAMVCYDLPWGSEVSFKEDLTTVSSTLTVSPVTPTLTPQEAHNG